jgi:hypothetical protein
VKAEMTAVEMGWISVARKVQMKASNLESLKVVAKVELKVVGMVLKMADMMVVERDES